jgi:hypothetical protein
MSTAKQPRMPLALFVERILLVMTILGLTCLGVGLFLTMAGRALNDSIVDRIGIYILLAGTLLVAMRIFYWIAEEIVRRGLEGMAKENTSSATSLSPFSQNGR